MLAAAMMLVLLQNVVERVAAPRLASILRRELLEALTQRFDSPVGLDTLQVRYQRGLLVEGGGLRIASVLHGVPGDAAKPMLQVKRFSFRSSLFSLLRSSPRLHDAHVEGVWLALPPVAVSGHAGNGGKKVDLDGVTVDDAHVVFASSDPNRASLVFDFPHGVLSGIRSARPFHFDVLVDSGSPIGVTRTSGSIGPWNFDDPRQTPVSGQTSFQEKDVSSVRGLRGHITLHMAYTGTFARMRAEGTTDDPAFGLDVSSHTVPLHTRFAILLDAVSSVIHLERLEADFQDTRFVCTGDVSKSPSYPGYNFDLLLDVPKGRVEDALLLGSRTVPPILRGGLTMHGTMRMQAGAEAVASRLQLLSTDFHVKDAVFSSAHVQQQVEEMSERAQGHPQEATPKEASNSPIRADGRLSLAGARLRFEQVRLALPGAQATASGLYSLNSTDFRLNGTVHTEAKASQMTTGLKSRVAKPFNGLFSHGREGATLPLNIHGSGNAVSFDVVLPGGKQMEAPAEHR